MKRSDLSTEMVIAAIDEHRFAAFEYLCERFPVNLVRAAFMRDVQRGYLNFGVALERPWVERRPMIAGTVPDSDGSSCV